MNLKPSLVLSVINNPYFRDVRVYTGIIRPILFIFSPESAHKIVFSFLKVIFRLPGIRRLVSGRYALNEKNLSRHLFGITFPNPVGLAAGFDKDAQSIDELAAFGFGFIEVGTVTPLPQPGNDKPRMFRLPMDEALINRMGFNNSGASAAASKLKRRSCGVIVGGNIGKNKATPNELAIADYEICFRELFEVVDYFAVNVSSPNTPGLRGLQDKEPLLSLLSRLQQLNKDLSSERKMKPKPVLLKIAPDLQEDQLDDVVEVVHKSGINGIIATNTTISRDNLKSGGELVSQAGGLSGKPLKDRSTFVIRYLKEKARGKFNIIGVGGIHSPDDAMEKLRAGADLVQLYTGFIYEGPGLVKKINEAILRENYAAGR